MGFGLVSPAGLYTKNKDCLTFDVDDALQILQRSFRTGVDCFPIVESMCDSPALKLAKPGYSNRVAFSNGIDYGVEGNLDQLLDLL